MKPSPCDMRRGDVDRHRTDTARRHEAGQVGELHLERRARSDRPWRRHAGTAGVPTPGVEHTRRGHRIEVRDGGIGVGGSGGSGVNQARSSGSSPSGDNRRPSNPRAVEQEFEAPGGKPGATREGKHRLEHHRAWAGVGADRGCGGLVVTDVQVVGRTLAGGATRQYGALRRVELDRPHQFGRERPAMMAKLNVTGNEKPL